MARNYDRKTNRKTRLPKVATSVGASGDPFTQPLELDWGKLESAFGRSLALNVRKDIREIIQAYVWIDEAEHNAPKLKDTLAPIDRRITAANALIKAMFAPNAKDRRLEAMADSQLAVFVDEGEFIRLVGKYINACNLACDNLRSRSQSAGFQDGSAWRGMIARLIGLFEKHNLPATVSNPVDSGCSPKPSPFVALIKAIGKQPLPVHWPWPSTDAALAKAIIKVRSQLRTANRTKLPHDFGGQST